MFDLLLNLPTEVLDIFLYVLFGTILLIHVLSGLLNERIERVLTCVNITLHIPLLCLLLLRGVGVDLAVLLFMISVFAYTLVRFIKYEIEIRRGRDDL